MEGTYGGTYGAPTPKDEEHVSCPACGGDGGFEDCEGAVLECAMCGGSGDVTPRQERQWIRSMVRR